MPELVYRTRRRQVAAAPFPVNTKFYMQPTPTMKERGNITYSFAIYAPLIL